VDDDDGLCLLDRHGDDVPDVHVRVVGLHVVTDPGHGGGGVGGKLADLVVCRRGGSFLSRLHAHLHAPSA
jgi:hypothetical protein